LKNWVEILGKKFQKTHTWFSCFKKLLSRSRSNIERKTKLLIALRWDWNTVIPINKIVLATKFYSIPTIVFRNCKNCIQKQILWVIFSRKCLACLKTRLYLTFSLLVQIEWIKDSCIDKNIIFNEKNFKNLILTFCDFFEV